jgi:putative hydrolase of the HAD superfamily
LAVGLASNFDGRLRAVAAGLPELAPIGPIIVSAEVGWRKPAAEFFAAVERAFSWAASEVLLVGDDMDNDYVGATAAGLRAVLLDPAGRPGIVGINRLADLVR